MSEEKQPLNFSDTEGAALVGDKKSKKKLIIGLVIGIAVIGVILAIVLPLTLKKKDDPTPAPPVNVNPYTYKETNPFRVDAASKQGGDVYLSFTADTTAQIPKPNTFFGNEQVGAAGQSYRPVDPNQIPNFEGGSSNSHWAHTVQFNLTVVDSKVAHLVVSSPDLNNYPVSNTIFTRPAESGKLADVSVSLNDDTFAINIGKDKNGKAIIDSTNRKLLLSDKFSEMGFIVPTTRLWGLGQRNGRLFLDSGSYTLFARGRQETLPEEDFLGGKSGNHIHPFILGQSADKTFFGIFFANSGPQHFEIIHYTQFEVAVINYIHLGSNIEVYFMFGPTPQSVIQTYHTMIGKSALLPYYALGVFQGADYATLHTESGMNSLFSSFNDNTFPVEGLVIEDYQAGPFQEFTLNKVNYPTLTDSLTKIKARNQRVVWGTSSAISFDKDYPLHGAAQTFDSIVKSGNIGQPQQLKELHTTVDGASVIYVNPFAARATDFYKSAVQSLTQNIAQIDGMYLQNAHHPSDIEGEINYSSQSRRILAVGGEDTIGNYQPYLVSADAKQQTMISTYFLPFLPNFAYSKYMDNRTVSLNATYTKSSNLFIHNTIAHRTFQVISPNTQVGTVRQFQMSDASWVGSGSLVAGVINNLLRDWTSLTNAIQMALGLSMYGINNVVLDVCGSGLKQEELCSRWMQLAALMPVARNAFTSTYYNPATGLVEPADPFLPFNLGFDAQLTYKSAVYQKLQLSRYVYTELFLANRDGGAVLRSLFFEFPEDENVYIKDTESTFMFGSSIKVSPVLTKGLAEGDNMNSYFPSGKWVDINSKTIVDSKGEYKSISTSLFSTSVHLRQGAVIPYLSLPQKVSTTRDMETKATTSFLINRDDKMAASGFFLLDDGISTDSVSSNKYGLWQVTAADNKITFAPNAGDKAYVPPNYTAHLVTDVTILNAGDDLSLITKACYFGAGTTPTKMVANYNKFSKFLQLKFLTSVAIGDIGYIQFVEKDGKECGN